MAATSTAVSTVDGAAAGYRPTATLTFRTELRRQATLETWDDGGAVSIHAGRGVRATGNG